MMRTSTILIPVVAGSQPLECMTTTTRTTSECRQLLHSSLSRYLTVRVCSYVEPILERGDEQKQDEEMGEAQDKQQDPECHKIGETSSDRLGRPRL